MREKYNQQKVLLEKRQLEIEHERVLHAALLGLLIFIILLAVIVYRYQRKLIRKERRLRESEEKLRQDTLKIEQNNAVIADNRRRIEELTLLMEADKDTYRQQAGEHQRVVQHLNGEIAALQAENEHLRQSAGQVEQGSGAVSAETVQQLRAQLDASRALLVMRTSTLASLIASPRFVDDAEFEKVKEEVDGIFDGYSRRLSEAFPLLTERDIHVALLIKLHLPNKSMAVIMAVSPTPVTKQKQRLKEHITQVVGDLGEGQTLETWLWEF